MNHTKILATLAVAAVIIFFLGYLGPMMISAKDTLLNMGGVLIGLALFYGVVSYIVSKF